MAIPKKRLIHGIGGSNADQTFRFYVLLNSGYGGDMEAGLTDCWSQVDRVSPDVREPVGKRAFGVPGSAGEARAVSRYQPLEPLELFDESLHCLNALDAVRLVDLDSLSHDVEAT